MRESSVSSIVNATTDDNQPELVPQKANLGFRSCSTYVRKYKNKSLLSQIFDILVLRYSFGQIGMSEYYSYRLYEDDRYSLAEKKAFLGWRRQKKIYDTYFSREWAAVNDKLLTASIA